MNYAIVGLNSVGPTRNFVIPAWIFGGIFLAASSSMHRATSKKLFDTGSAFCIYADLSGKIHQEGITLLECFLSLLQSSRRQYIEKNMYGKGSSHSQDTPQRNSEDSWDCDTSVNRSNCIQPLSLLNLFQLSTIPCPLYAYV